MTRMSHRPNRAVILARGDVSKASMPRECRGSDNQACERAPGAKVSTAVGIPGRVGSRSSTPGCRLPATARRTMPAGVLRRPPRRRTCEGGRRSGMNSTRSKRCCSRPPRPAKMARCTGFERAPRSRPADAAGRAARRGGHCPSGVRGARGRQLLDLALPWTTYLLRRSTRANPWARAVEAVGEMPLRPKPNSYPSVNRVDALNIDGQARIDLGEKPARVGRSGPVTTGVRRGPSRRY